MSALPTVERWAVMVQRELADRLFARPSTKPYSAVSILVQLHCELERVRPVPRNAFRPRPNVESSFLTFTRRPRLETGEWDVGDERLDAAGYARLEPLVRLAFTQRRKLLTNALSGAGPALAPSRERVREALRAVGARREGAPRGALACRLGPVRPRPGYLEGRRRGGRGGHMNDEAHPQTVVVAAPAKLNLALLVGPRRPDGFHEIASLMVPVTLADRVEVTPTPGRGLEVDCPVCPGEANLAARMVRALEERLERTFEVRLAIHKRVPAGAGLGGGSSDAAAALVALERLYGLELTPRLRHEAALAVGSDVPFFLWTGPQLAMGRGQVLKPVDLPGPLHFVIAVPELALSTADVYRWRDEDVTVGLHEFAPRARLLSAGIAGASKVADCRRAGQQRPRDQRRRAAARGRPGDRRASGPPARSPPA